MNMMIRCSGLTLEGRVSDSILIELALSLLLYYIP